MTLISSGWSEGKSVMELSGGRGLGPEGAMRLAEVLQKAPHHSLLASIDLRHSFPPPSFFTLSIPYLPFCAQNCYIFSLELMLSPSRDAFYVLWGREWVGLD